MMVQAKLSLIAEDGIPVDALNVFAVDWQLRRSWGIFQAGAIVRPRYWGFGSDGVLHLLASIGDSSTLQVFPMDGLFSLIGPARELS